jgi:hypothetical protein
MLLKMIWRRSLLRVKRDQARMPRSHLPKRRLPLKEEKNRRRQQRPLLSKNHWKP